MKRLLLTTLGAAMLCASPALAQEPEPDAGEFAGFGDLLQGMFPAEALTADEEARLPRASEVVAQVMPAGIYARMMRQTLDGVLGPLLTLAPQAMPPAEIATRLGVNAEDVEQLEAEEVARIGAMLDPAYAQRQQGMIDYMMESMIDVMSSMEPGIRSGLSRAYAQRFTDAELADIAIFFGTPTGARYASESLLLFADPQTMAGTMEAMPALFGMLPDLMQGAEQATSSLPPERGYADLSSAERTRLAASLGLSENELKIAMLAAEKLRAETEADLPEL